jgi:GNAT superfamily N-acetyltransferase
MLNVVFTEVLSAGEFNAIRMSVGWEPINTALARKGLEGSALVVAARVCGRAVGMARVISDGGYIAYVSDVAVMPEYQGQWIGKALMKRVIDFIRGGIGAGEQRHIILFAEGGCGGFYKKFGFSEREDVLCMTVWEEKIGGLVW